MTKKSKQTPIEPTLSKAEVLEMAKNANWLRLDLKTVEKGLGFGHLPMNMTQYYIKSPPRL